ncbi:pdhC [Symbiodinium necroappetens]|uniref:Dihydrolipoamide acetyltransferase component of pyruvate dehydrogenase complex n=1 Tax=Symbiodinium necroappetens TaxID=1628268 RepID=A0A813BJC2_9DINO|nr:pdhC [Symbiodinium necroappetens]
MAGQTSTDPNVFILPDLGEGVHEAELISWKVSPGETVEEHQVVAEMETDKALVEVPSPRDGVIKELFGEVGEILKVGNVAWTYEGAGEVAEPAPAPKQETAPAAPATEEREDDGTVVGTMSGSLGAVTKSEGKALATPAVRRLARDLGVDIDAVNGSGIAGRVTEKDVRAASNGVAAPAPKPAPTPPTPAAPAAAPAPAPAKRLATTVPSQSVAPRPNVLVPSGGDTTIIPMRGVRRTIANRLRQSVDMAVHFSVMDDADVSALDKTRKQLAMASGEKLSYLPFVVSAVCRALKEFPALNAHVDDENEQILRSNKVHMGIATDTEQGLSVPVIPDADARGVLEIGREITALAQMTRDRSVPGERLKGSTFTISNVGSYAGRYATPIINYPEVGILAAGRVRDGVVADNGAIRVAKLMPLSLTCDHRSVDGAEAAQCLALIIELLKRPDELLTPVRG